MFDNLPGKGKPIPDLHTERPPGWWAARVVKSEQDKATRELLLAEVRRAMPSLWRLPDAAAVRHEVARLNKTISEYNRWTSEPTVDPLDVETVLRRWDGVQAVR